MTACTVCQLGTKTTGDGTVVHSDTGLSAGYALRPHHAMVAS